ncbi:MAG: hypothetical protein ACPG7F_18510 [Aggregatilineales bacterium]
MVVLVISWFPRGEMMRLERHLPQLRNIYERIIISMPPHATYKDLTYFAALDEVIAFKNKIRAEGRFRGLEKALATSADFIHYTDGDRLIRWIETRPDELQQTVLDLQNYECSVIGRSAYALNTHPKTLTDTEKIINMVFSQYIGQSLDFGGGSKAFSRRAVEFLMQHAKPDSGLGNDTEWAVLCYRAGFSIGNIRVDGLDWETADRQQNHAADNDSQMSLADKLDADPKQWQFRVQMAADIITAGLGAMQRPLSE